MSLGGQKASDEGEELRDEESADLRLHRLVTAAECLQGIGCREQVSMRPLEQP
jgi:hypothetical protein